MSDVDIGPYRCDVLKETGVYVSTIFRESSAMEHASPYFETMVLPLDREHHEILWQSAAGYRRKADHQHDVAVRWFSRPWRAVRHD